MLSDKAIAEGPTYNEQKVRMQLINPIVKALGYADGENVYMELEERLSYPYTQVGRRSKKDVPIGFADYWAGVKGARGSFIIEAKAGSVAIDQLAIEQAHSYAAHPQCSANYFMLCNGSELQIFETLSGPNAMPILAMNWREVSERFHEIQAVLSPESIVENCKVEYDFGKRLAPGYPSTIRVRHGVYSLRSWSVRYYLNGQDQTSLAYAMIPNLREMDTFLEHFRSSFEMRVKDGKVYRDVDGKINIDAEFDGVTVHNKAAMDQMGIANMLLTTSSETISVDGNDPTFFESRSDFAIRAGDVLPALLGEPTLMQNDVDGYLFIRASVSLDKKIARGEYKGLSDYYMMLPIGSVKIEFDMVGDFEMEID